ncbi:hypothetical protein GOM49_06440 [Clostridium bovifaecis]|uniref:Uncharacterized protein n=1 Tax=Clostridium bovifaecis TaxID=2184719 RepID=A0A6I6EM41_9CLOT|nr:hypothetical protein GOM49_06440 [Clostridium bovifaecis]
MQIEEIIETSHGYLRSGIVGMALSCYIRKLRYEARNNMDGNCLVIEPLVDKMKNSSEAMVNILKEYDEKYKIKRYIKSL